MADKQKKINVEGSNVYIGEKSSGRKPGITGIENWESDFGSMQSWNDIEKILEFPGTDDMAGVLSRANFRNEEQRVAAVLLAYRNRKFHDTQHQEMLRDFCASTLGTRGLGKILQTFVSTKLLAPDIIRAIFGMEKSKRPDEVHRGRSSDLRSDGMEKEEKD